MKKILLTLIPAVVFIGLLYGGYMYKQYVDFYASIVPIANASTTKAFTLAEVTEHKDATSCYTIINDKVYDFTSWVDKHPGGAKRVLDNCGKDGTVKFEKKHSEDTKPNEILINFQIGVLTK
jgi:cytochrome b involved in lipid metabolism